MKYRKENQKTNQEKKDYVDDSLEYRKGKLNKRTRQGLKKTMKQIFRQNNYKKIQNYLPIA